MVHALPGRPADGVIGAADDRWSRGSATPAPLPWSAAFATARPAAARPFPRSTRADAHAGRASLNQSGLELEEDSRKSLQNGTTALR